MRTTDWLPYPNYSDKKYVAIVVGGSGPFSLDYADGWLKMNKMKVGTEPCHCVKKQ